MNGRQKRGFADLFRSRPGMVFAILAVAFAVGFIAVAAATQGKGDEAEVDPYATQFGTTSPTSAPSQDKSKSGASDKRDADERATKSDDLQAAADAAAKASGSMPIGVAITRLGSDELVEAGTKSDYQLWSTSKVPSIASYLDTFKTWQGSDRATMQNAIQNSDNVAVRKLIKSTINKLGFAEARQNLIDVVEQGGASLSRVPTRPDPSIDNSLAAGLSHWSPADAATFYKAFANGCAVPQAKEGVRDVLTAMNNIQGSGRFGAVGTFPADRTFSKSGWPSNGTDVSQVAIIGRGDDALVIAMAVGPTSLAGGAPVITKAMRAIEKELELPPAGGGSLPRDCP